MARIRRFSIAATLGLALLTMASPATAYIVGALTSIRAEDAADDATLEKAIRAAVDDVATHAVAFRPTMVSLREAKLVGDRIYLLVLLADQAGEKELEVFPTERRGPASVAEQSRRVQLHSHAAGYRPTFRRGREASRVPGQSPCRSIQSVCGDAADRLAPHEPAIFALPALSTNALTSRGYVQSAEPACRLQSRPVGDAG